MNRRIRLLALASGLAAAVGFATAALAAGPAPEGANIATAELHAQAKLQWEPTVRGLGQAGSLKSRDVLRVALDAPAPDKVAPVAPAKGAPLQVGFGRSVAVLASAAEMRGALRWQRLADGSQVAAVSVTSPTALAIRAALRVEAIPAHAIVRFQAPGSATIFEDAGQALLDTVQRNVDAGDKSLEASLYWSPVLEGDTVAVEIELPPGSSPQDLRISIPHVSHLITTAKKDFAVKALDFCEIDATCSSGTWGVQMNAVARLLFSTGSGTFFCSGTLLADQDTSSNVPYFLTANHCISTQTAASSLATYWFYRSSSCNATTLSPQSTQLTGGATLLYNTTLTDTSFMRLNNSPPTGAVYAAWSASAAPVGTSITGLHHPQGDWLKISGGGIQGYLDCTAPDSTGKFSCNPGTNFYNLSWTSGITEPGSSGSGLFRNSDGALIGQLYGGTQTCSAAGPDIYGRFDVAFNNGLKNWLTATTLTVTKSGAGTGAASSSPAGINNCATTCTASFPAGTSVTLTAQPATGSVFAGWSGACTGTGTCTVALNSASSVNAAFAIATATLTVASAGSGTVSSSPAGINCGATCSATYPAGTQVVLSAAPASGMVFNGWSGACSGTSTCTVTMNANSSVTASFGPAPSADVFVTQTMSPSAPLAGKDIVFTVNASNKGPAVATIVTVRDTLPPGTVYVWSSSGCSLSANVVTCSAISVAPGIVVPFTIVARPTAAGTITNTVEIAAAQPDPDPSNNSAALTINVGAPPTANVVTRYRLYSPITHEHHFTTDLNEYNFLGTLVGSWQQEGASGKVMDNPGSFNGVTAVPYYRLYHAGLMLHHWTTDPNEYYTLAKYYGWNPEGVDGYLLPSNTAGATQLYRLVFPNSSLHHWTTDASEYQTLISVYGWIGEGNSGYVIQ